MVAVGIVLWQDHTEKSNLFKCKNNKKADKRKELAEKQSKANK